MAERITVGSVGVDVVPNAERFAKDLHAKLDPQSRQIGDELGKIMGRALADKVSDGVGQGLRDGHTGTAELEGGKAGRGFGDEFSRIARSRIRAAFNSLPKADLNVDATKADLRIAEMRRQLSTLAKDISLGVDDKEALAKIGALAEFMKRTLKDASDIRVRVDVGKALAEIEALKLALSGGEGGIKGGASSGGGGPFGFLSGLIDTGGAGLRPMTALILGLISLAPALYNALIVIGAGLAGLVAALSVATLGFGALVAGGIAAFQFFSANDKLLETAKTKLGTDQGKLTADQLKLSGQKKPSASTLASITLDKQAIGKDQAQIAKLTKQLGPDGLAAAAGMRQLSAEWSNFGKAVLPLVLPILVTGLKALNTFLPALEPIVKAVAPVVTTMLQNVGKALNGPAGKQFMAFIAKQAPALVKDIGDIVGHVVGFLASFIVGFTPIGKKILDWLDNVTKNLGGFSKSKGFQQFLADVKADAPSVLNFFRAVGKFIGALILEFEALQPIGVLILNTFTYVIIPALIEITRATTGLIIGLFVVLGKAVGGFLTALADVASALHLPFANALKTAAHNVTDWTNQLQANFDKLAAGINGIQTGINDISGNHPVTFTLGINTGHVSEHGGAGKAISAALVAAAEKNYGHVLKGSSTGGLITGAGTATSDSIPAALSNGEYVMKAASVAKYGTDMMRAINDGKFQPGVHRSLEITVDGYGAHEVASLIVHKQQQYELLHAER